MKYRIMKTDNGKYLAQVKRGWFSEWDDIFYAGVSGLVEYSKYKRWRGAHNNRWSETIEECERIIEAHKRNEIVESGANLTKVREYD